MKVRLLALHSQMAWTEATGFGDGLTARLSENFSNTLVLYDSGRGYETNELHMST